MEREKYFPPPRSTFVWDKLDVNPTVILRLGIPSSAFYCFEFKIVLISLGLRLFGYAVWQGLVLLRDWQLLVADVSYASDEEGSLILFSDLPNFGRWRGRPEEEKKQARSVPNS